MGHLINPIAFRLGWSREWVDDFFIELRFYPELLHRLLRFRFFLNCFFSATATSSVHFNYYIISHFSFFLDLRGFCLQVYYYNSRMDPCWYDFFEKLSRRQFGLRFFPKSRNEAPAFSSWNRKCLSLLFMLYHYSANGVLDQPYIYRLPFFKAYQDTLQSADFAYTYPRFVWKKMKIRKRHLSPSEKECFILLHLIRFHTLQETGRLRFVFRGEGLRLVNYESVAQTFFRLLYVYHITKPYMYSFFLWIRYLGRYFFIRNSLSVCFFQISNEQISARFLAKFLAIRFSQGLTVRSIINPIRKDLRLSKRFASRLNYKSTELQRKYAQAKRGSFPTLLSLLFFCSFFLPKTIFNRKTFWNFDVFFLTFHLKTVLKPCLSSVMVTQASLISAYKLLREYQRKRFLFGFISHFTQDSKKLFFFYNYPVAFFFELLDDRFLAYNSARSMIQSDSFMSLRGLTFSNLLYLTGATLVSFLSFSVQSSTPARSLDTLFAYRRRNYRSFGVPVLGLRGFRIRLHGRFTRKQIAASYHFQEGAMPLSTISSCIDYGFATKPLRNSAIGIKVWFYRQGFVKDSDFFFSFT